MENQKSETTPWSDCPLDIFSSGETDWAFKIYLSSFRRPFTEVGIITLCYFPLWVNYHPLFFRPASFLIVRINRMHPAKARPQGTTRVAPVDSSDGGGTRWVKRISTVAAESSDYGVNLRTVQNLFFQQLLSNLMEQTKVGL